jgi:hypothetical protein
LIIDTTEKGGKNIQAAAYNGAAQYIWYSSSHEIAFPQYLLLTILRKKADAINMNDLSICDFICIYVYI